MSVAIAAKPEITWPTLKIICAKRSERSRVELQAKEAPASSKAGAKLPRLIACDQSSAHREIHDYLNVTKAVASRPE
jgi:hypothetical protein